MGFLMDYIGFLWLWGISVGNNHVHHIDLTHLMSREQFFSVTAIKYRHLKRKVFTILNVALWKSYRLTASIRIKTVCHVLTIKCSWLTGHLLYKRRCFGSFLGWRFQVCLNTMSQSSSQINTKVRLCNDQRNCKKTPSLRVPVRLARQMLKFMTTKLKKAE